VLVASARGPP